MNYRPNVYINRTRTSSGRGTLLKMGYPPVQRRENHVNHGSQKIGNTTDNASEDYPPLCHVGSTGTACIRNQEGTCFCLPRLKCPQRGFPED